MMTMTTCTNNTAAALRTNRTIIIIGEKGSGKTFYTRNSIIQRYQEKGKPIIIVDSIDHIDYADVPQVSIEKYSFQKSGTYRIIGQSKIEKVLQVVSARTYNSVVIFEDASKYINNVMPRCVLNFVLDSKQKNCDIFFMFHNWNYIPPKLLSLTDAIILFQCKSSPLAKKNFLPAVERIVEAHERNMKAAAEGIKYTREYITTN